MALPFVGWELGPTIELMIMIVFVMTGMVVVGAIMYFTKFYKKILWRWPITVIYFDHRQGKPILKIDKMRRAVAKDGLEGAVLLNADQILDFPSLSDLFQSGKQTVYFAHRLETDQWLPLKFKFETPDMDAITELKDLKFSKNMKKILDRDTRQRYKPTNWLERYGWLALPIAMGICFLLMAYATWTYYLEPIYISSRGLSSESLEIAKLWNENLKISRGEQIGPTPIIPSSTPTAPK